MSKPVILCVDDEKIILTSLKEQLKRPFGKEFSVETVESGEEAIELFEELMKDATDVPLVITDHIMPGIKGDSLLIRFHMLAPETLNVLLTGQANADAVGNAVNHANLYRYIAKPWDKEDLVLTVREATRKYFYIKQLKEKEEEYRSLVEALNVGVCRTSADARGLFLKVNPALSRIFGYHSIEKFLQTSVSSHFEDPEDLKSVIRKIQKQGYCKDLEIRMQKKDGTPLWASLSSTAQYGKSGNIKWMDSVIEDITERKRSNEHLRKLNTAYQRFVPGEFLKTLGKKSIIEVELNDQVRKRMSILFSDIRNFSSLSEIMTPEENFRFINSYLSRMGPLVRKYRGFIDKYIGDSIMALFEIGADNAVQAANVMIQELKEYNEGRKRAGYHMIRIGIGINTGNLMLGTLGEHNRMEGTVISDAVNMASRLEGLTKVYGTPLLISEYSLHSLRDRSRYFLRFIDRVQVKGKSESVSVYEIFDSDQPDLRNKKQVNLNMFEDAIYHYHFHDIGIAGKLLERYLALNPEDTAANAYLKRCWTFQKPSGSRHLKNQRVSEALAPWKRTSISIVDEKQKSVYRQTLQLMEAVKSGPGKEKFDRLWAALHSASKKLFALEEEILAKHECPLLHEHRNQHIKYLDNLKKINDEVQYEGKQDLHLLLSIQTELVDWIKNHCLNTNPIFGVTSAEERNNKKVENEGGKCRFKYYKRSKEDKSA